MGADKTFTAYIVYPYMHSGVTKYSVLGFLNPTLRQNSTNVTSQHMQLKNSEDR